MTGQRLPAPRGSREAPKGQFYASRRFEVARDASKTRSVWSERARHATSRINRVWVT